MSLVYAVHETRSRIREIQANARNGLVSELLNKSTHDSMYLISEKMFESMILALAVNNVTEFDEKLGIYTIYNELVPQLVGEGSTREDAVEQLVEGSIQFAQDYLEHADVYSGIFDGLQQLLISLIILSEGDRNRVREVLKIA